ncbi:hypothetical protein PAXRUDRAFT_693155 [Paxillus rubicundulus Ve08.2h10]|uniref:Complex 1 LYR protein domain-containing protein n=1 Tax=Paxillus rubicundulus Ve08.2h10 TaxID=930991 RepID=A0A0D0CU00_9AGAM|nr:hypothetical protein PAXRUDRAFT_693155 [Paxillus rubicundulus Ve08.2h10]
MSPRKSGLQREVLALYRRALRMVRTKPAHAQPKFTLFVRHAFHTQTAAVSPRNVTAIEHLLRRGRKQIETYESPSIKDCQISQAMRDWEQAWRLSRHGVQSS